MSIIPVFGPFNDDIESGFVKPRRVKHVSSAFTGGTPNAHGDHDGTGDPYTIFTVTGIVAVFGFFGVCNVALVGAATLEAGVTGNTGILISQETDVSATINLNNIWTLTDVGKFGAQLDATFRDNAIIINGTGTNIIETTGVANITAGQLDYYCIWAPMEIGASIV